MKAKSVQSKEQPVVKKAAEVEISTALRPLERESYLKKSDKNLNKHERNVPSFACGRRQHLLMSYSGI